MLEGRQTAHFRVLLDYTLDVTTPHGVRHATAHQATDVWVTDMGVDIASPFAARMRPDMILDDSSRSVHRALATLNPKLGDGVALRHVVRTTVVVEGGPTMDDTQTVQINDIHQSPIDEAYLQVPSDYKKTAGPGQ
jgi:hypothetical protein